ncbi:MAG: penicillin-binding protein 2 [Lentisphaeria bacterium]|nr:penicillin-binding protein 2 [Lentisphaeria bacterium]
MKKEEAFNLNQFRQKRRLVILSIFFFIGFLLLLIRLYNEQIRHGELHRERISRQSIRRIRIPAKRGNIYSADHKLLAGNSGQMQLLFYPEEMRVSSRRSKTIDHIVQSAARIAHAVGRPSPLTRESVSRHLWRPGLPLVVFHDLTPEEAARALEASRNIRGVELDETEVRIYPQQSCAAHLIGYIQPDSPQQAPDKEDFSYYVPDMVGKAGLEKAFDRLPGTEERSGLRGLPGYSLVQVDSLGFIRQTLIEKIEPHHGNHLVSTLDLSAQQTAEKVLGNERGALVLVDASNGDILAAASTPSYDLSMFSPKIPRNYYDHLLKSPGKPLINRALNGTYPPGSILKPLIALAILNDGHTGDEKVVCDGKTVIGDARIRCASYRSGGHGELDLVGALAYSCNDYMIEKGVAVGHRKLEEILHSAGIGRKAGTELPEASGIFPSNLEKRKRYRYNWNSYDTGLLSIGQGIITVTPLQAALWTAAIANGGKVWKPHLALRMVDSLGNTIYERRPQLTGELKTTPEALETVRKGMFEVVHDSMGSGREARIDGLKICGKTGSAEVGSRQNRSHITWFICYFTHKERTYAMAVMVEDGRSGGKTCAPIARRFIRQWLLK